MRDATRHEDGWPTSSAEGAQLSVPVGRPRRRGRAFRAAALVLALATTITGAACWLRSPNDPEPPTSAGGAAASDKAAAGPGSAQALFAGWPKPDLALVLSAQQHGYILPCGCSRPQYGGLERRYNFLQGLRDKNWSLVPLDLGDIPQMRGPATLPNVQGLVKYRVTMEALKKMGYAAVSFGEYEAAQPLTDALDEYALNNKEPAVLAANLLQRTELFPDSSRRSKSYVGDWEVVPVKSGLKVGVVGSIAPSVADKIKDPKFKFGRGDVVLPQTLQQMHAAEAPDLRVLLLQGSREEAKKCAAALPQFHVILCLAEEDEPPGRPEIVGDTYIVRVGHKGKNLGVVGVNRTSDPRKPFELRYQLVTLGEEYQTPADKEAGHPILALMERYTKELRDENYLARYAQGTHAVQFGASQLPAYKDKAAGYAGSESCKKCHEHAYEVWKNSAHAHAYQTLVDARRPSLRQYDAECIACHVVGFGYRTGFASAEKTPKLKDVGCESCHGPSLLHKENPNDTDLYPLINPFKAKPGETAKDREKRMLAIEQDCQKCHDQDNDVHWTFDKWTKKGIIHMTPAE